MTPHKAIDFIPAVKVTGLVFQYIFVWHVAEEERERRTGSTAAKIASREPQAAGSNILGSQLHTLQLPQPAQAASPANLHLGAAFGIQPWSPPPWNEESTDVLQGQQHTPRA